MVKVLSRYEGMALMAMNIWSIRNQSGDIVPVILSARADGVTKPMFNIGVSINPDIFQFQYSICRRDVMRREARRTEREKASR